MISYYDLSEEAHSLIVAQSEQFYPDETGGILVGKFWDGYVEIKYAVDAGPRAIHSPSYFKRDGDYSQEALDRIVRQSKGTFDYVGEWHSHPARSSISPTDIRSMRWIVANDKYATKTPVLLLCVKHSKSMWRLHCYLFSRACLQRLHCGTSA